MAKTYTTGQVIDLLKPEQLAQSVNEGEVAVITVDAQGRVVYADNHANRRGHVIILNHATRVVKWQIMPRYVDFEEALRAYKDGKPIRYESQHGNWFIYTPSNPHYDVSFQRILHGKWSIVESEVD